MKWVCAERYGCALRLHLVWAPCPDGDRFRSCSDGLNNGIVMRSTITDKARWGEECPTCARHFRAEGAFDDPLFVRATEVVLGDTQKFS